MRKIVLLFVVFVSIPSILFAENFFLLSIKNGYNNNVNETKRKKGSFYNNISINDILSFKILPLTFTTELNFTKFYKDFNTVSEIVEDISFKFRKIEIYSGGSYYRDLNDDQNSYTGFYSGLKFFYFEYSFFYKDYLKNYTYGSYKGFRYQYFKQNKFKVLSEKKKKEKKGIHFSNVSFLYNNPNLITKSQYDKINTFKISFKNLSFSYSLNNSNIKSEDYELYEVGLNYSGEINVFDYDFSLFSGRKRYLNTYRKDFYFSFGCEIDYYLNDKIFFSAGVKLVNDNSNFEDEDFFKLDSWISIGLNF